MDLYVEMDGCEALCSDTLHYTIREHEYEHVLVHVLVLVLVHVLISLTSHFHANRTETNEWKAKNSS